MKKLFMVFMLALSFAVIGVADIADGETTYNITSTDDPGTGGR